MERMIIIGAGASGVYLSLLMKQKKPEMDVIVLEQNATSLKKLLASGNGRCNLSHKGIDAHCYFSDDNNLVAEIVSDFDMLENMKNIGLYCTYQGDLLYPRSEQALSVKRILMNEAQRNGVVFLYDQKVKEIKKTTPYRVICENQTYKGDYIVFAMGSEAGKLSGITNERYDMLKKLKLNVIPTKPSLVQMMTKPVKKSLKGVRIKGTFTLYHHNSIVKQEKGELLFTDYGISGIAIMQLSSYIDDDCNYEIGIDFLDELSIEKVKEYIEFSMEKDYNHPYDGLINTKIAAYFESLGSLSLEERACLFKDFRIQITGLRSFENAQVMKGGLSLDEVTSHLEIKKYPHMYACGEILNVAGLCGGYNLHFAFASAYRIANTIGREKEC